jgi:hypothetical protein
VKHVLTPAGLGIARYRSIKVASAVSNGGILYATGNPGHPLLKDAVGEGCIAKPYTASTIVSALRVVGERMAQVPLSAFHLGYTLLRT